MLILELASNITLRLFLRPFEAVLSLKSLFERVPGGLQGSYFVWRAKMRNYYHLESSLEAVRPILKSEAARGRSSDLEPPRGQIWHPEVRASHLSIIYGGLGGSRSLERPRAASDFKIGRTASRLLSIVYDRNRFGFGFRPNFGQFGRNSVWPKLRNPFRFRFRYRPKQKSCFGS